MAQAGPSDRAQGASLPPKPIGPAGTVTGSTPFKPPSSGSTSAVVEASGTANPGVVVPAANNTLGRPVSQTPWNQNYGNQNYGSNYGNNYGGYGGYNNSSLYNSYGGYNNRMYNNGTYNRFGGYGGSSMYGGGYYNGGYGGSAMSPYGTGMMGPYNNQDPNSPFGPPPSPPSFWMSFLHVMHGVVNFCGRVSMLVDQNTQAFLAIISALLQFFDCSGLLYGELARFVLRILGRKAIKQQQQQLQQQQKLQPNNEVKSLIPQGPNGAGSWDNVWGDGSQKAP